MTTPAWRIVRGPSEFSATPDGADIDVGWSWEIRAEGAGNRYVTVEVAGGRLHSDELPDDARRAIATRGESAVRAILGELNPPARLVVSSLGVRPREP